MFSHYNGFQISIGTFRNSVMCLVLLGDVRESPVNFYFPDDHMTASGWAAEAESELPHIGSVVICFRRMSYYAL